jgi:hypothetical protein
MKKLLFIAVLSFAVNSLVAQPQLIRILGQQYSSASTWVDSSELLFEYNTNKLVSEITQRNLQGTQPRPQKLDSFIYNSNGKIKEQRKYHWDLNINSWIPDVFSKHSYNSNNLVELIEYDDYYSLGINKYNDSFWYNSNNKLETKVLGDRNNIRWVYTYYSNGFLKAEIEQRGSNNTGWTDFIRVENTKYDVNGNVTESVRSFKSSSQPGWKFINKQTFTYDVTDQKLLEQVSEYWQNNAWQLGGKSIYSYNPNRTIKEILRQVYNGSGWDNQSRDLYFYKNGTTGVTTLDKHNISFVTHPNPATDFITLSFFDDEPKKISITDMQGKQVYNSATNTNEVNINMCMYAKGVYFIKVESETVIGTHKLVLQ